MDHSTTNTLNAVALSQEERAFFTQLGTRIAQRRKTQGIAQVQLAELLDVSQQTITACEVGRRRIQVFALPVISQALRLPVEELLGDQPKTTSGKRGPAPKLQQQMDRIARLPKAQPRFVMRVFESVLAQAAR